MATIGRLICTSVNNTIWDLANWPVYAIGRWPSYPGPTGCGCTKEVHDRLNQVTVEAGSTVLQVCLIEQGQTFVLRRMHIILSFHKQISMKSFLLELLKEWQGRALG